jgi:hypothetical protein
MEIFSGMSYTQKIRASIICQSIRAWLSPDASVLGVGWGNGVEDQSFDTVLLNDVLHHVENCAHSGGLSPTWYSDFIDRVRENLCKICFLAIPSNGS